MKLRRTLPLIAALTLTLLASAVGRTEASCVRTFKLIDGVTPAIKSFYYVRDGIQSRNLISDRPNMVYKNEQPITLEGGGPFQFHVVLTSSPPEVVGTVKDLCELTYIIIVYDADHQPVMNFQ